MDQNNKKKLENDFEMKDVSDSSNNINYVNGKNATTNSNNEFVINDLSFEDFKFDAKLEGGNVTMKSDDSSSEKSLDDNNSSNKQESDSKDTSTSNNKNDSNSDTSNNNDSNSNTSNNNDMKDVSDDNLENSNNQSNSSNNSNEDKNNEKQDNKNEDNEKLDENKEDSDSKDKKSLDDKENKDDSKDKKDDKENKEDSDKKENDKDKEKDKKDESNNRDKEKKHDGLDDKDKNDPNKKENDKKDNNKENQNKNNNDQSNNGNKNNSKKPDNNQSNNGNKETPKKNDSNKKNNSDRRPNAYQRKKDDLKNKWNNRPKTPKDFAKRAGNGLKNKAKDTVNNSAPARAVNKAKETVQKTQETIEKTKKIVKHLIKYWKVYAIGAGVGLVVFAVIIFCSLTATGINGNVNDDGGSDKYSEKDQETLEKLKEIFESHSGVDGTVAMATVALPYYETMINGNVKGYLNAPTPSDEDDGNDDEENNETTTSSNDDDKDIDETDNTTDDTFLAVFRQKRVRKRLNKLLDEYSKGEDSYKSYLKDHYFDSDGGYKYYISRPSFITGYNGYKKLFDDIKDEYKDKKDNLKDAIIENIYEISSLFAPYVYENSECATNLIDAGSISTTELLKANVLVDLKKPGCSSIDSCTESYYDHYLTLEEYVKGVVYEEMGSSTDVDVLAAQMVAAKTYTLSRHSPKKDPTSGAYVMTMLWSTADQDFCHTEKGCDSSDIKPYYGYNTGGDERLMHGNNRGPLSDNQKTLYDSAWNKSKDTYILDSNGNPAKVSYWEGGGCNPGNCMEQSALEAMTNTGDYNIILSKFYTNFSLATVQGDSTNIQKVGAPVCTNNTENLTAKRNKVVSFANNYVKKIPYDADKLAKVSGFEGNDFGIETREVAGTPTEFKTGLGVIGFVNWVYWSTINENFGNTNDIQMIINNSFEITKDKLLLGDIGYSTDKSLVAIYAGDEKWIYEDAITNNVIIQPSDKFTKFIRLNSFKDEIYDYPIRTKRPTPTEWNMNDTSKWAYYADEFIGECPWFARNRAAEIINGLYASGSLTKAKYNTLISRVVCCYGDGGQFFPGGAADGGCGTKKFKGSTNIKDIKTGSFLSKSSGSQWGHVMVVEYANPQEDKIILSDGYNKSGMDDMCTKTNFNCGVMNFNVQYTYQQFYNEFSSTFKGYLYFLEE